jgi:hypothetical protein
MLGERARFFRFNLRIVRPMLGTAVVCRRNCPRKDRGKPVQGNMTARVAFNKCGGT